ncbi:MAG: substrate-binding domain-containing protein [Gammaproteobacteria bacterium]|nr:substrate-binding domain-containing protein [Gammaproteobacteria bacterium]
MIRPFLLFLILIASPLLVSAEIDKKVIAFAQDTMSNDFRKAQVFEVRDAIANYPELAFVYSDAQGQTSLMIRQIDQFIQQKVDLLIIGTNDENAVVPVVSKAYKSGIPIIVLDRGIKGSDFTTFINSDNIRIGQIGAEQIAQQINGKGTVLLLEGIKEADVTKHRSMGFLNEIAKHKNIKVIRRTGNFLRKDAIIEMEKLIKEGIHVDAIFSESDSMLSGVRMVLKRYRINPQSIVMVGVDFTSEAKEAIRNGSQTSSILFPLGGIKAVETAVNILNNQPVIKHINSPVRLITKINVEETAPIF